MRFGAGAPLGYTCPTRLGTVTFAAGALTSVRAPRAGAAGRSLRMPTAGKAMAMHANAMAVRAVVGLAVCITRALRLGVTLGRPARTWPAAIERDEREAVSSSSSGAIGGGGSGGGSSLACSTESSTAALAEGGPPVANPSVWGMALLAFDRPFRTTIAFDRPFSVPLWGKSARM